MEGCGANLLATPARETILIDSGENQAHHAARMHNAARSAGLERTDHHIVTHWHTGHSGGTNELAKLLPIRNYYAGTPFAGRVDDDTKSPFLCRSSKRRTGANRGSWRLGMLSRSVKYPGTPRCRFALSAGIAGRSRRVLAVRRIQPVARRSLRLVSTTARMPCN